MIPFGLNAQSQNPDSIIQKDVEVRAVQTRGILARENVVLITNKTGVPIDSLFIGCKYLGSLDKDDSLFVPDQYFENVVFANGSPIEKVKFSSLNCPNRPKPQEELTVELKCIPSKMVVTKKLDIVWLVDDKPYRQMIWQKHHE